MEALKKVGRTITYTKELGEEICLQVATSECGLARLCRENPHWPVRQTIFEWRIKIKDFGDNYAKAKQQQVENLIDQILDIADDTSNDSIIRTNKEGEEYEVCNTEWINRSRVRIDTRKWIASKLAPKLYGEKVQIENDPAANEDIKTAREIVHKCKPRKD